MDVEWWIGLTAATAGALGALLAIVRRVRRWVASISAKLSELEDALATRRKVRTTRACMVEAPGMPGGLLTLPSGVLGTIQRADRDRVLIRLDGQTTEVWTPLDALEEAE